MPESNLVLLHHNPEGFNKIQDHYKDQKFIVEKAQSKNVYIIKPFNGNDEKLETVHY